MAARTKRARDEPADAEASAPARKRIKVESAAAAGESDGAGGLPTRPSVSTMGLRVAPSRPAGERRFWMLKSEPECFSIDELARQGEAIWDGVRNHQAKNFLTSMARGDVGFFYHSSVKPPGVVGLLEVMGAPVVDPTQFDARSPYYDSKATPDKPRWHTARVRFLQKFEPMLTIAALREAFTPDELVTLRRGNRLSVMPVERAPAAKLLALLGVAELPPVTMGKLEADAK